MRTLDKGKRPMTDGAEEDEELPIDRAALLASIDKLHEIQDEIEKVNEEASNKVLEIQAKYHNIRKPVYVRRNEITQKIPKFWLTAFLCHPMLCDLLTEDDQQIFKHLESLFVDDCEDIKSGCTGCSITLTFSPNPYFEDKKLTKVYYLNDDGTVTGKATSINWKAGMDIVSGKTCTKKGKKRLLVDESFFAWFSDTENKHGEVDQVADVIMEDLWPNAFKYINKELQDGFELEDDEEEGSDGS